MLFDLRNHLRRHHVTHLLGVQLAVVAMLCVSLVVASASTAQAHLRAARALATAHGAAAHAPLVTPANAPAQLEAADAAVIQLRDLDPDAARRWNAANPISSAPNPPAKPFNLAAEGVLDEARAVDCMTAAIYYEAGFESLDGQRAVAQVVINRLRNHLFPKTVCGVVFQGAERTTGCQFTFTCDGALAHAPQTLAWQRSREVAIAALHGSVMKAVGNATHYHAAYVAPYWSPTLVKVAVIGQHIFYRWTGGMGMPPAFGGRYAGGEANGLQMATLDNLSRGSSTLAPSTAPAEEGPPSQSAEVAEAAPAQAADVAEAAPPAGPAASESMVTTETIAANASTMVKAEDLDWQGRPRQRAPSRIARPGLGPGGF